MQDLISRGPWDVFIDDGSPVPWNRELGQRNWGQGPGGSKLGRELGQGTGDREPGDRELGTGHWGQGIWDRELGDRELGQGTGDRELGDRELGTGNWGQGIGPGNGAQGTCVGG